MEAGARGDPGSTAPGRVEVGWSSPTGSVRSRSPRTEGDIVRGREFNTSPAALGPVRTVRVRIHSLHTSVYLNVSSYPVVAYGQMRLNIFRDSCVFTDAGLLHSQGGVSGRSSVRNTTA